MQDQHDLRLSASDWGKNTEDDDGYMASTAAADGQFLFLHLSFFGGGGGGGGYRAWKSFLPRTQSIHQSNDLLLHLYLYLTRSDAYNQAQCLKLPKGFLVGPHTITSADLGANCEGARAL